MEQNKIIG